MIVLKSVIEKKLNMVLKSALKRIIPILIDVGITTAVIYTVTNFRRITHILDN